MKKLCLLLSLAITASACVGCSVSLGGEDILPISATAEEVTQEGVNSFLILGDSIAAHYGVEDGEGYDSRLGEMLNATGEKWVGNNWGVSGYTSGDLYTLLNKSLDDERRTILEAADLICISIGGNNLLHHLKKHGIDGFSGETGVGTWAKLARAFADGSEEMCIELKSDLTAIMHLIRSVNPTAPVLVQNVHNVARDAGDTLKIFGREVSPTALTEPFFRPLLSTIEGGAEELGYVVADTYSAFATSPEPQLLRRELIHPNARGHALVAQVLFDTYQGLPKD